MQNSRVGGSVRHSAVSAAVRAGVKVFQKAGVVIIPPEWQPWGVDPNASNVQATFEGWLSGSPLRGAQTQT